ncbi:lysine-2,3-aminomutase-like protein [Devosia aquimaris]|uniref:lysine-2,3-aminomutase-like protein n=1 Tax=Devosia aquimaris TaxID=2866214 RepID=UPI001CD18BF8|nr:lysine-2,3-aminomutase-like protein [Devosia sp. CJK-A8-3]
MSVVRAIKTVDELVAAGLGPDATGLDAVAAKYAVAITPAVAALIDFGNPDDPMARQFVPRMEELETTPDERADPIGDLSHSPVTGIVHRYPDRVLLKAVHVCPVYCRFCFRREMVGPQGLGTLTPAELDAAMDYIAGHSEIWEVILTGGDPLVLSPRRLGDLMARLAGIDHVKVVRFHTRVPVVEPERIDDAMVAALLASGKTTYLAIHANHPREFTPAAKAGMALMHKAGLALVSQSVLLKGVNDDVETLAALMQAFVENRVQPYYLHHPDLAPGTSHFRLSIAEGQALVSQLRGRISGLAQPIYVLDIPGGFGKADIGASAIAAADGGWIVRDWQGQAHAYPPRDQSGQD